MTGSTINLTPTPEILAVIAEVDLQLHQCLAEFIDNSLDELVEATKIDSELEPRIDVSIPTPGKVGANPTISVADNGRGMTAEQLESALRAGSSGKSRHGSLGMFGMGFNIASARLGGVTEVRTGRKGDTHWAIATIDLREMQRLGSYLVPLRTEDKDIDEHGTSITVSRLQEDIQSKLRAQNQISNVKSNLGRVYTYMLRKPDGVYSGASFMGGCGLSLYVNDRAVEPYLPCIWDPSRSVSYKGGAVQAAAAIDIPLTSAWACLNCGHWYAHRPEKCVTCESEDIDLRERRVWGWIGVQRYADKSDFGFSFFREGRCIAYQDKSLFDWEDDDGTRELEYPIELGMGRIVGEIHVDHIKPNVRKTDFDRSSTDWATMVEKVRGRSPLRPNIAKSRNYPANETILGKYFNAFRRNDPGVNFLMPGNGSKALLDLARNWANEFRKGDPDYLTDEKWWDAAKQHDDIKSGRQDGEGQGDGDDGATDWLDEEGLGHLNVGGGDVKSPTGTNAAAPEPTRPETDEERFARYRAASRLLTDSDREIRIDTSRTYLRVYATRGVLLVTDGQSKQYVARAVEGTFEIFVDEAGSLIAEFGWEPMDAALVFAAGDLQKYFQYQGTLDELVRDLMNEYPDRKVDAAAVRSRGQAILDDIRDRLANVTTDEPEAFWNALSPESRRAAENVAVSQAPNITWDAKVTDGGFAQYITVSGVRDLVEDRADLVLDGILFRSSYKGLSEETREDQVARVSGLLADLRRILDGPQTPNPRELLRFLLSAELLELEVASP